MKTKILTIGLLLIVILTLVGCTEQIELSELQSDACNTADKADTCNSRLVEVGIVLPEECCQVLENVVKK